MITQIAEPAFVRSDQRGDFFEITDGGTWQTVIYGRMNAGAVLGNHYHKQTTALFYLTSGRARIESVQVETGQRDAFILEPNTSALLPVMVSHAIRFIDPGEFIMLKDVRYNPDDPDIHPFPVSPA